MLDRFWQWLLDLIFPDSYVPGEDGPETLAQIKENNPNATHKEHLYMYEGQLEYWGWKEPDPIILENH